MTSTIPARAAAVIAGVALALTACGGDSDDGGASNDGDDGAGLASDTGTRTVNVEMRDNEFSPDSIEVGEGETVRFVFRNRGAVTHDAVLGDEAAQEQHETEMREAESAAGDGGMDMDMDHGTESEGAGHGEDESAVTVEPGERGELTHTFEAGHELLVGCHEEGHYAEGMRIAIDVTGHRSHDR